MSVTPATEVSERSLTLTRVFNAPRSVVFKAWTDPKQLMQWWGPKHHPADHIEMDVRKDGSWRNRLRRLAARRGAAQGRARGHRRHAQSR